jgi:DNA-binding transcriptional LysR family regulator
MAADTGAFSRAASALHISTPAFSQQIKLLERELEFRLFLRSKHGVQLTAAGESFYKTAQQLEQVFASGHLQALRLASQESEQLLVACEFTDKPAVFETDIVRLCKQALPDSAIRFLSVQRKDVLDSIFKGIVDVGFYTMPDDDRAGQLCFEPLYNDNVFCCISPTDELAAQETVCFADLSDRTVYIEDAATHIPSMQRFFEQGKLDVQNVVYNAALINQVSIDGGAVFIPESYLATLCPPLIAVKLDWPSLTHGVIYHSDPKAVVLDFVEVARQYFNQKTTDSSL